MADRNGDDVNKKLDRLDERLDTISETLIKNTTSLQQHMRRTELLEEDFKPVKAHVTFMNNLAKLASLALAGLLAAKTLELI